MLGGKMIGESKGGKTKREEDGWVMENTALSKTPLMGVEGMGCLSLVPGSSVDGHG